MSQNTTKFVRGYYFKLTTCFGPCLGPPSGHKSIYSRKLYSIRPTKFPRINNFVAWRWPRKWAETCGQFKIITSNKLSCVLTHLKASPECITKHNGDDTSKDYWSEAYVGQKSCKYQNTRLCVSTTYLKRDFRLSPRSRWELSSAGL